VKDKVKKMENELIALDVEQIFVWQGSIQFAEFERLKDQALTLAGEIRTVEVNDETIKTSKKLLAEINKSLKVLDDKRISIKKLMLEPYQVFEGQVKEIIGIVKEADEIVRDQVRNFEEGQRRHKEAVLEDKFQKRIVHYSFRDLFKFQDFLNPKHLNKTMSIEAVEKEMVDFLNNISRDMKAIERMANPEALLAYYTDVKDLAVAITLHEQQEARKRQIEASKALVKKTPNKISYLISAQIYDQKDLALVEMFFKQQEINYSIDKII
jgi:hypothetical protein